MSTDWYFQRFCFTLYDKVLIFARKYFVATKEKAHMHECSPEYHNASQLQTTTLCDSKSTTQYGPLPPPPPLQQDSIHFLKNVSYTGNTSETRLLWIWVQLS
jgi:hypothetical protein